MRAIDHQRRPHSERADAQRNRARLLDAARQLMAGVEQPGRSPGNLSMAAVAREAGVGRATLYRNFTDRRELLEALLVDHVEALLAAAVPSADDPAGALLRWLRHFATFEGRKHPVANELLEHIDLGDPTFVSSRSRVIAAGEPLLAAAQRAGVVRSDITLVQALDLVLAVTGLDRDPDQIDAILDVALDGLRARR